MTRQEKQRENYLRRRAALGDDWFRERNRKSYQKNKEKTLRRHRWYYYQNRERVIARTTAYNKSNPTIGEKARANYVFRNPERPNEALVEYRTRNRHKINLRARERYWNNRDAILRRNSISRNHNREKYRSYDRDFRTKNRNRIAQLARSARHRRGIEISVIAVMQSAKRRALTSAATRNPKAVESFIRNIKASEHVNCFWCGDSIPGNKTHIDHVIALCKGGLHAVENLVASCPSCNLSKGAKSVADWEQYKSEVSHK